MKSKFIINIHSMRPTKKNPYVAAVIYNRLTERIYTHRGIDPIPLIYRPMVEEEISCYRKSWREIYYRYKTWEGLISDEIAITKDQNWINKLEKLKNNE
jgi:hypothetical protein